MNILFTICARAGSKGIKGKNLRVFMGQPLLYTTLSAIDLFTKQFGSGDRVDIALNTDSPELLAQLGGQLLQVLHVERKPELAGDRAPKIAVVADTYLAAKAQTGREYDIVVDADLTSPIRRASDIQNVIAALAGAPGADAALTVTEARRNPYFNQLKKTGDGLLQTVMQSDFVARQQAPEIFDANASLYAYRPVYLTNNDGVLLHAKLVGSVMTDTGVLDIDNEGDFELIEHIAMYFKKADDGVRDVLNNIANLLK